MGGDLHSILGAALACIGVAALVQLWWGHLQIPSLADVPGIASARAPAISIVIAARNEERHIASAVRALLDQNYPRFEVIVVDDRSTDGTTRILAELARSDERLRVVRVESLPDGWLGKNHALQRGAERAAGDVLLFADGDVILERDTLARAARLLELHRADLLAVAPDLVAPSAPLALVVSYFMMWFLLYLRPWKASDPRSRAFIGIGAFNMIRASAYHAVGGHSRIALRPDDDIMLGKLVKRAGLSECLATADGTLRVEWYATLGEMARGFRKNAFAGLNYSLLLVTGTVIGNLLLAVWPFVAVFLADEPARLLYATAAIAQMLAFATSPVIRKGRLWLAALYPIASVLFIGILVAAVTRTVRRGGIEWRETFYPLARLRANRV